MKYWLLFLWCYLIRRSHSLSVAAFFLPISAMTMHSTTVLEANPPGITENTSADPSASRSVRISHKNAVCFEKIILAQRLVEAGVASESLILESDEETGRRLNTTSENYVYEIKTLIWEATSSNSDSSRYVVTALPMDARVDTSALMELCRDLLSPSFNKEDDAVANSSYVRQMSLAPREIAESLTGFVSGCMPPLGHDTSLELLIDTSIPKIDPKTTNISSTETDQKFLSDEWTSIGSGISGFSLLLPLKDFWHAAHATSKRVAFGSFAQQSDIKSCNPSQSTSAGSENADNDSTNTSQETRQQSKIERMGRQSKPKDRLNEFRVFRRGKRVIDQAKLFRSTARRKDLFTDVQILVEDAVSHNEFRQMLELNPEQGLSKNALHQAAWRGSLDSVKLLIETAKIQCPDLDAVNQISRGPGNYGKAPIFYALTQCRAEIVRYLIDEQGANLLIVNNKGQTPCSIAVSHLDNELCDHMFEIEARQLKEGGRFLDYRQSHSDEKFYGDLDPRFPIDNFNFGEDLKQPLIEFQTAVTKSDPSSIINGIPTQFLPRSLRPTVRWWQKKENVTIEGEAPSFEAAMSSIKKNTTSKIARSPSPVRDVLPDLPRIETLETLTFDNVLQNRESVVLVNSTEALDDLESEIDRVISHILSNQDQLDMDEMLVNCSWGLDCEWKPGIERGKDNPVSTLQLSTRKKSFLIDLQSLCQATSKNDFDNAVIPNPLEAHLETILKRLFDDERMLLVGFGILQDLGKLAASFPHLKCFARYNAVLDLQAVASVVYPKRSRPQLASLQKMTATLLQKKLDKSEQCSDWTRRPLALSQIEYATLDAAVLPLLLEIIFKTSVTLNSYNGHFFAIQSKLLSNVLYTHVEPQLHIPGKNAWIVPMGSIREVLGKTIARQVWSNHETPAPPRLVELDPNRITNKEKAHIAKIGGNSKTKKPKAVQLKTLTANLDNLPLPGMVLGYTKDSCAERIVGHELMNTLPEGTHIGFNRRSGVIECSNAFILFCNFGASLSKSLEMGRRTSEFSGEGKYLSFSIRPSRKNGSEATLADYIKSNGSQERRKILLFAREGTSTKYLFCGSVKCHDYSEGNETMDVTFELEDFSKLTDGSSRLSETFVDLVASRETFFRGI